MSSISLPVVVLPTRHVESIEHTSRALTDLCLWREWCTLLSFDENFFGGDTMKAVIPPPPRFTE